MKVRHKIIKQKSYRFDELYSGQCFKENVSSNYIYMKLQVHPKSEAVDIKTGKFLSMYPENKVYPVEGTFVEE